MATVVAVAIMVRVTLVVVSELNSDSGRAVGDSEALPTIIETVMAVAVTEMKSCDGDVEQDYPR